LAGRAEARRDRQGDRVLRSLDHVVNSAAFSPTGRASFSRLKKTKSPASGTRIKLKMTAFQKKRNPLLSQFR
jgi:hypothetical protein